MSTADRYEEQEARKRRQGAASNVPNNQNFVGPTLDPEVIAARKAGTGTSPAVTMEEAYNAEYGQPRFGSGVPGESGRQARQSILDLRRQFAGTSGAFGQQLRSLRAQQAEAAEQYGSAMAQRAGGMSGGLRQRGFENMVNQYRAQQARIGAQRRGIQGDLFRDISSVRNLLDQRKFEEALSRAAAVSSYWNKVLESGRQLSPEAAAIIEQYGMGGAQ